MNHPFPVRVAAGSRFIHRDDPYGNQRLVLGEDGVGTVHAHGKRRGADTENVIIAHKFEEANFKGKQNVGEDHPGGWHFELMLADGTILTAQTDSSMPSTGSSSGRPPIRWTKLSNSKSALSSPLPASSPTTGNVTITWTGLTDDVFGVPTEHCDLPFEIPFPT